MLTKKPRLSMLLSFFKFPSDKPDVVKKVYSSKGNNKCNLRYQEELESRFAEIAKVYFKSPLKLKKHSRDLVKFQYLAKIFVRESIIIPLYKHNP
jgi:hypothetical protein